MTTSSSAGAGGVHVLLVDHDADVVRALEGVLHQSACTVITAGSCSAGLASRDTIGEAVQVFVVEFSLPDGDGPDFVRNAAAKYGPRPTIYVSAWTGELLTFPEESPHWLLMRKPLNPSHVVLAVRWLVEGDPGHQSWAPELAGESGWAYSCP